MYLPIGTLTYITITLTTHGGGGAGAGAGPNLLHPIIVPRKRLPEPEGWLDRYVWWGKVRKVL